MTEKKREQEREREREQERGVAVRVLIDRRIYWPTPISFFSDTTIEGLFCFVSVDGKRKY